MCKGVDHCLISKELKKLSRRELVDIIYQLKKNEQQMQEKIAALEEALQEKRIRVSVAGSIAEAAADITNLFSTAQLTADLYLREIASMKADTERECAKIIEDARVRVEQIISGAENQANDLFCPDQSWLFQDETQAPEQMRRYRLYEDTGNG
jgi:cell division septum initiation protein DivIVA